MTAVTPVDPERGLLEGALDIAADAYPGLDLELQRRRIDALKRDIWLEVDGGIKTDNIADVARAGADTFVAGSAVFNSKDYAATIRDMRAQLAAARK